MNNLYLYFSGTGNTKYVMEKFSSLYEDTEFIIKSIEENEFNFNKAIKESNIIIIGYPIYGCTMPIIMIDFLEKYLETFRNKKIITIATQMEFSGDGAALAYYLLKKANVNILHSIHIKMPNNISDFFIFKILSSEKTDIVIRKADNKINEIVTKIKSGKTIKNGRRFYSRIVGYVMQRLVFNIFRKKMQKLISINHDKCITCKKCIEICPTNNLYLEDNLIKTKNKCTLCYRCVNSCPTQAMSLFSKKSPKVQYIRNDYN